MLRRTSAVLLLVAASLAACRAGGVAVRAAETGDLPTLRDRIAQGEKVTNLHMPEVFDLARATAEHELKAATADEAIERIRDVGACVPEMRDALRDRMKKGDHASGEAALALLDAGELGEGEARSYAGSTDASFRALGVRSLTRGRDRDARKNALLDPSPEVRRAALRAMAEDLSASDLPSVFEVARTDPVPILRTDAVRLLRLIGRENDDHGKVASDIVRLLGDLYPTADDPLREDIGAAWAVPPVFLHGGRERLRLLLDSEQGAGALSAAAAFLREPRLHDPEIQAAAEATLSRAIVSGARRHRLHAIAIVPLAVHAHDKGASLLLDALQKAAADDDAEVAVASLGRLASEGAPLAGRAQAIMRLEVFAAKPDAAAVASRARLSLARAGDVRVQAWLEKDLTDKDAWGRLSAVSALIALGRATRAAPILADGDVTVRTRGACSLLLAARLGSSLR